MIRWGLLALLGGLIAATSAQAEWLEARSRHFVLYADANERTVRQQAELLERVDEGLRRFMGVADEPEIESRKVTVFMVFDRTIAKLCQCSDVAGFYLSRVSGSIAYAGTGGWSGSSFGRIVLFHEYAHHFLLGSYDQAFPSWYSEGFAEFASTMRIGDDGVTIGHAAQHRALGLHLSEGITVAEILDPARHAQTGNSMQSEIYYARGWLMTHYMTFNPERRAQFGRYIAAVNDGTPALDAARGAFGDLDALNKEVSAYLRRKRIPGLTVPFGNVAAPPVAIRKLSRGESALIDLRMTSVRGVDEEDARALYAKAAPIAARHPDDVAVQGWFAEMAFDAGQYDVAEAAAARVIALDPSSVQGLLYRARVQLRRLQDAASTDAKAWDAARASVIAANRADPDDAEPLWWFWRSFELEGRTPTASAFKALYRAQELAPQDEGVRFTAGRERIKANQMTEAKALLRPLAYNPHIAADNPASQMITAIEAGKTGAAVIAAGEEAEKKLAEQATAAATEQD